MASEQRANEVLKGLCDGVVAFDEETVGKFSKAAVEEGVDAYDAITKGLAHGMGKVGELYAAHEYFVPELLLCADALYVGLDILRPHLKRSDSGKSARRIVLGVAEGDVHDIGKNLVKIMFDAAAWEVYDLGKDVPLGSFVEEQQRTNADVVGVSALMATSMLAMPEVTRMIKTRNPNVVVMLGGAPLTREIARSYGADGYADNAGEAVREAVRLVEVIK